MKYAFTLSHEASRFVGCFAELHGQHGEVADEHGQLGNAGLALEPVSRQRVRHLTGKGVVSGGGQTVWLLSGQ